MVSGRRRRAAVCLSAAATAAAIPFLVAGCYPGSDAQVSQRQAQARNEAATRSLRAATAETARGAPLEGAALRARVVERTWFSEFGQFPDGKPGSYRVQEYFRKDGQFVMADNWVHRDPVPRAGDTWRIDGPRLCILHQQWSAQPRCYTAALDERQALQLYIDEPGSANHGLLTRRIRRMEDGPPRPQELKGQ